MGPREWGWWTRQKLDILGAYLQEFARASSKVEERIYLDLFAGWAENRDRDTGEQFLGSVHRALAARPEFTRVCLFELASKAAALRETLADMYPGRSGITVYPGDCNATIPRAFADLASVRWAPTFAFVDQFDSEIRWRTLQQISRFRRGATKAEMWILFGTSFYQRGLNVKKPMMDARYGEEMTAMFGTEDWVPIIQARRQGALTPGGAREELLNLMRWRLQDELGYRFSYSLTMINTNGHDLYDMIFVSDHQAGEKIMRHLYGKAKGEQGELLRQAQRRRNERRRADAGLVPLFEVEDGATAVSSVSVDFSQEPPLPPYGER